MKDENNESPALFGLEAYDTTAGAEEGSVMEVIGPAGEVLRWPDGRPWTITYYGADAKVLQTLVLAQSDRNTQHFFNTSNPQPAQVTQRNMLDYLVAATKSWDIMLANGEPAKNDPSEYRAAYQRYRWLSNQGHVFVKTNANFLRIGGESS